jgi:hypothetical protein
LRTALTSSLSWLSKRCSRRRKCCSKAVTEAAEAKTLVARSALARVGEEQEKGGEREQERRTNGV